jgi:hypothetical protein
MANWLNDLTRQHRDLESPESFWFWAGVTAISAVLKDSVWLDRQIFNTYPNIYVMLHADSGLKKGPPVSAARQLVRQVNNTRIIGGRSSIQGILKEMGSAQTQKGGTILTKSVAFICSSELSSSIVEDKVATKILTDLYDRSYNIGEWKSLLKMESFELKDPTVTMLTATNEAMAEDFFTKAAIQGGYFARTFIIYEKEGKVDNSLIYPLKQKPDYIAAAEYLKVLAKLQGPFHPLASMEQSDEYRFKKVKNGREIWFNPTGIIYDDWYDEFKKIIRQAENKDETGTMNRFGDSVLKIAMLLALAEKPELYISEDAMGTAITQCEKLLGNVRKTTLGKHGISDTAQLKVMLINELLSRQDCRCPRPTLMKKFWAHYSSVEEFDGVISSFQGAGLIEIVTAGNMIIYQIPEKQAKELLRYMSGKGMM